MDKASDYVPTKEERANEIRTPVKEDERLFYTKPRGGVKIRYWQWLPFEERYWPGDKYGDVTLGDGITVLLLRRSYNPKLGKFEFSIHPAHKLEADVHPNTTKAYVGFMLVGPDAAMAALLIPASAKSPID